MSEPKPDLLDAIERLGLARSSAPPPMEQLTGGVSSDIWRVDLETGPVCVKRALARLKVEADWRAPTARNAYEAAWFEVVADIDPRAAPRLIGQSADDGLLAMEFLDPSAYPLWKRELLAGRADAGFAAEVGRRLAAIHSATAKTPELASRFDSDAIFHAIRLEPYLEATARVHVDLADRLHALVSITAGTKRALVHGDVSPKNILGGPRGPVFLDAECAWYGDPAFDVAFCLNHLLLKCLHAPAVTSGYLACFDVLRGAYFAGVDWEPQEELESRTAALLPGLFLARVDGKSPVEYLTQDAQRDCVRRVARRFLAEPVARLQDIQVEWSAAVAKAEGIKE